MPIYNGAPPLLPPSRRSFQKSPHPQKLNPTRALPGMGAFSAGLQPVPAQSTLRSRPELLRPLAVPPTRKRDGRAVVPERRGKENGQSGGALCPGLRPRVAIAAGTWRLASSGVGVAAGSRRRGGSPRLVAQTADFFLRGRALDPAEAVQTVGLEPELEGDGAPARKLAGAGKFPRAGLHALQSLAQVSLLLCHEGKFSAGP